MPPRIVFLDRETFPNYIDFPPPKFPHQWQEYAWTEPYELAKRIKNAHILIVNKVKLRGKELAKTTVKLIALAATGSNNIDLDYCNAHNIAVANIRNYGSSSVAEHTLALILTLRRRLLPYKERIAAGEWQRHRQFVLFDEPIEDLYGSTLGILGKGVLGTQVAASAQSLGMKVLFAEHKNAMQCRPTHHPFREVLMRSDIFSLHCPLTPDNHQLMGASEFTLMKNTALFINTARGALVDEQALAAALLNKQIGGVGLDVLSSEPPNLTNPLLRLANYPNVLITPHTAWTSTQAMTKAAQQTMENIEAFLAGTPIRLITTMPRS